MVHALNSPLREAAIRVAKGVGAGLDLDLLQQVFESELADAADRTNALPSIAEALEFQLELIPSEARQAFLEGELLRCRLRPIADEACRILVRVCQAGAVPAADLARAAEMRDAVAAIQEEARALAKPVGPHLADGQVASVLMSCESILDGGQELGFREVAQLLQNPWNEPSGNLP